MTLLLGFGAVNTGNNLLYLIVSALLGFMAVSGVLGRGNIAALDVSVDLPPEIYAGQETLVSFRLVNRRRLLPAFLVQVLLLGGKALFPFVDRKGYATAGMIVSFKRRGRWPLPPVQVRSIFPINFFIRQRLVELPRQVTVFPAPVPCRPADAGGEKGRGSWRHHQRGYEGEISRITDYRGGDPLKMIHWKLSARQEELMVKELSAGTHDPVIIDPDYLPGGDLESRLGAAAFLVNHLQRQGRPVGLRLDGHLIHPQVSNRHRLRMLRALALHDTDQQTT
jgi:uncharacterized protein (DUF58 family)